MKQLRFDVTDEFISSDVTDEFISSLPLTLRKQNICFLFPWVVVSHIFF